MLAVMVSGCGPSRLGPPTEDAAKAIARRIMHRSEGIGDATLVGRFILESEKGSTRGSLRVRYIRPDLYRVDAILRGAAGAGGGTSFVVEGDSSLVYANPGVEAEARSLERQGVVTFLEDFELQLEDLKALAVSEPYLKSLPLEQARCRSVRGGYLLEGHGPSGEILSIWIDEDREAVVRGLRGERSGLPLVETELSRFRLFDGVWRPTRIVVRHFGQGASLSVQYELISVNEGLRRDDLLIRGAGS